MGAPYRLYTQISPDYNASIYYRIMLPFIMFEKLGLPVETVVDWGEADVPANVRHSMMLESDFCVQYQITSEYRREIMNQSRTLHPMKDASGNMRWPCTFVIDTDDDLFNVQPLNLTFGRYGIHRPDGTDMKDGDEIGVAHPLEIAAPEIQEALHAKHPGPLIGDREEHNGNRYIFEKDAQWHDYFSLWKDGRNMSVSAARKNTDLWREIMKAAHLITCSTPFVEKYVKRELGPDAPTFVTPNAINFDEYPNVELAEHPGEVRILWQGSATHHEDLWPLNDSISRLAAKYPQTTWVFWGAPYKWARKNIPAERVKFIEWCHYEAYKTRLSTINHDINLCPLTPNVFNDCRSCIKWYESSAICKPAATLAQRTGSYAEELQDGETGLLFSTPEEFELKLGGLIEDATLRQRLSSNAKDWMKSNRDARHVMNRLFQKYVEVREAHKLTIPIPQEVESALPT